MILRFFTLFLILLISLTLQAEIVVDGSLGPQRTLQGPDYQIEAALGYQQGNNLFHSFSQFKLTSQESAVFSGPLTIKNIITRITGGQPAFINGDLVSTMPNANFFLLNPAGAVFGPQAQLDIKGSFHLSTADYLRLGQNGYFYAQPLRGDVLSTAPPTAFGFLKSPQEALISFQGTGHQIYANMSQKSGLGVATGKTFSVIGDQIHINQGNYYLQENGQTVRLNNLFAPSGYIQLISVGAAYGEVALTPTFDLNVHGELGTIGMNDHVLIDVSGARPGHISLIGKKLMLHNSYLFAHALDTPEHSSTFNDHPSIQIIADELSLKNSSGFLTHSFTNANAGNIRVQARRLSLEQDSRIESYAFSSGHAGNITVAASHLSLNQSSWIASRLYQSGNAGDISLKAHSITLNDGSWISSNADLPDSKSFNKALEVTLKSAEQLNMTQEYPSGNTSNITIETQDMFLKNGGIASVTHGSGQAGSIHIHAQGHITVVGADPSSGWQSQILAVSDPSVAGIRGGTAGDITLNAHSISLEGGGQVSSSTVAAQNRYSASAGNIH
ncbi:MAG: filamentous hemagglutinin N-terminal domain-containing protein, partial [Pseudomonadota bacterium]|nr:filamentous hemagglutinin N-terminal domain-containing protein [Pseudomonadota bacterium]